MTEVQGNFEAPVTTLESGHAFEAADVLADAEVPMGSYRFPGLTEALDTIMVQVDAQGQITVLVNEGVEFGGKGDGKKDRKPQEKVDGAQKGKKGGGNETKDPFHRVPKGTPTRTGGRV